MPDKRKFSIFISSTYEDLKEERQALIGVALESNFIPVGMEQFHAAPANQWDVITKMIDQCDFYFLIIGGRYGSIDESVDKSYTEKEYDYAKSKGLKVLVLVKKNDSITEDKKDSGDNKYDLMKRLDQFRERVQNDNNTVDFFSDISQMKYVASQAFKNAVEYADPSAGWVRYQEVLDIINESIETKDSKSSSGKASAITPEEMDSLFHVNGETLAIGHPVSKEINPFDDMERFQDAIHSAFPECYDSIHCIEDPAIIRGLLDSINTPTYDNRLWYNDGRHSLEIYYYEPLDENNYIINKCQHVIKKIWCITSDNLYDDLFLLEWETPEPYVINGKQYTRVLRLNGKIYPGDTIDTGKIRLEDGKVHSISDFKDALEISIIPSYFNYMFIAPHSNSFTNPKNDKLLLRLKGNPITGDLLMGLVPALEKRDEVLMRL